MILKSIIKQEQDLLVRSPVGVKIIINQEDPMDIQADINGPHATPYENGIFRIKLILPNEFPHAPPKGYFITKIFHPNVSAKGEICVNTLKKDWNPKNWSLYHVLEVIKCLLIVPFPESSLNEEAGKLFMENYQEYFKIAKLYANIHSIENKAKSIITNNLKANEICLFDLHESENKRVILSNDHTIINENNILIQKNTNESEKCLGKKLSRHLPMTNTINELIQSENNLVQRFENKESKTNLRTFELLRKNSTQLINSKEALNVFNTNITCIDEFDNKNEKKEDIKKWISRI